jgi:hypothetical protein
MPYLNPATLEEAIALAQDLRTEDAAEIKAMSGQELVVSLCHGVQFSDLPTTILNDNGDILGMFGAVSLGDNPRLGVVWMLCSPRRKSSGPALRISSSTSCPTWAWAATSITGPWPFKASGFPTLAQ